MGNNVEKLLIVNDKKTNLFIDDVGRMVCHIDDIIDIVVYKGNQYEVTVLSGNAYYKIFTKEITYKLRKRRYDMDILQSLKTF